MKNNIRVIILFISILPLLLITGCVSSKTKPEKTTIQDYRPPALSNEVIDRRIDEIKKLLNENSLSDDRKETGLSIIKAYDKLKSLNSSNIAEKEYRKLVQLLFNTLVEVETQYFYGGIVVSGEAAEEIIIENYSELKKQIHRNYYAGDFKGVISGCEELMVRFGKSGLTPDVGIMLVEALFKNNMTADALSIARSLLGVVESKPDLIRLLADAIELELKAGNIENAKRLYEKLADNINERNSLYQKIRDLLSGYQDGGTIVDKSLKEKISEIDPELKILLDQLMENVNKFLSQKDFSGARLELVRRRLRAEEGPELEMIEQLMKSVDKAEEQFNRQTSNDKLIIEDARRLIEEEKFEDALDILKPIIVEEGNYEAEKIKKEAIEKLIIRDKLNAVKLRMAAKKESDLKKKRELLLKAKIMLKNLIDKYPASPLLKKSHILKIDEELMQLPPTND